MSKKSNVGGAREGAGAPLKDPDSGPRIMWSGRLAAKSHAILKARATDDLSQSGIIDAALALWDAATSGKKSAKPPPLTRENLLVETPV